MEGSASLSYSTEADDWAWSEMLMFCVTVGHSETRELTQFVFCSKINARLCNTLFTWISLLLGMLWLVGPQQQKQSEMNSSSLCLADTSEGEWGDTLQLLYHSIQDIFQFFSFPSATILLPFKFCRYFLWKISQGPKKQWEILARGPVRMGNTLCFAGYMHLQVCKCVVELHNVQWRGS